MTRPAPAERLAKILRRKLVVDLPALRKALDGRSPRSLFRDLSALDHLVSYSHAGRYFALRASAVFDEDGLWRHGGIGFSTHGTLKDTAALLVDRAATGHTHAELGARLGVRVQNSLLDLVREGRLRRERLGGSLLYTASDSERAAAQLSARRQLLALPAPPGPPAAVVVVEILVELIHRARARGSPEEIVAGLAARGVAVTLTDVERVLREHGIQKKGRHSRSQRSRG
jgi:hypothetical protein